MNKLKRTNEQIKDEAYQNVEGFDHTGLCYKTIFEIMQNVILKAIDETSHFNIVYQDQIDLMEFQYGVIKECDGKVYPCVELMVNFQEEESKGNYLYRVSFSPFTCKFNKWNNPVPRYSKCDDKLTKCWHIIMKGFFEENWIKAYKKYCLDVKCLKESKIAMKAEKQYLKIEQEYEDEINSI